MRRQNLQRLKAGAVVFRFLALFLFAEEIARAFARMIDRAEIDLGLEHRHLGNELALEHQRLEIDQLGKRRVQPARAQPESPLVFLSAMLDHTHRHVEFEQGQARIGQDQVDVQFGRRKQHVAQRNRGHLEMHPEFTLSDLPVGGVVLLDSLQELDHPQVFPARAHLEADVVFFAADRNGKERDLALEIRHLGVKERSELLDLIEHARQRDQLVPVACVGVVGLGQIDFIIGPHVAVDTARFAAGFMVIIEQHLLAKGDLGEAIAAFMIDPEIFAVAFLIGGGGGGNNSDVSGNRGGIARLDRQLAPHRHASRIKRLPAVGVGVIFFSQIDFARLTQIAVNFAGISAIEMPGGNYHLRAWLDILRGLAAFMVDTEKRAIAWRGDLANISVSLGAHRIRSEHHARRRSRPLGDRLVTDGGFERGGHGAAHRHVAADIEHHLVDGRQHLGRVFIANAGAKERIDGLGEEVLCFPTNGVVGERDAHRGTARGDARLVFGGNAGLVLSLDREVAARNHFTARDGGARTAQHQIGGNRAVDRNRNGCSRPAGIGDAGAGIAGRGGIRDG